MRKPRPRQHPQFAPFADFIRRFARTEWPDPSLPRQHQGSREFTLLRKWYGACCGRRIDPLGYEVRCNGATRTPSAHQAARAALGVRRVIHGASPEQPFHHLPHRIRR